jgi:uncharacterized repeat protein (TIGR01451 family)
LNSRPLLLIGIIVIGGLLSLAQVSGKSLYIITDINANPTPIGAYDIQPSPGYLVHQSTNYVPRRGSGGVGLGIDSDSGILFVTYEDSDVIELVDATTMNNTGYIVAPGAGNLAGIVYDRGQSKVYTVDRSTDNLYTYSWDPETGNLTLISNIDLPGVELAHGLALDEREGLLYVGDVAGYGLPEGPRDSIKVFSTDDWAPVANYTVNQTVMAVAVDSRNGFIYAGNAYPGYGSKGLLVKYDTATGQESWIDIRPLTGFSQDNVVGIAVDRDTGLVYITTGNQGGGGSGRLLVFDSDLEFLHGTEYVGSPTGIAIPSEDISYNPLALVKTSSKDRASTGSKVTYDISFDNSGNEYPITNVFVEDVLPPGLEFVSASGNHSYHESSHRVCWVIGDVEAGEKGPTLQLVAKVRGNLTKGEIIDNAAIIDSDQTPPTTKHAYVEVGGFSLGLGGLGGPMVRDVALIGGIVAASYAVGWAAAGAITKFWLIPKGAEASTQLLVGRLAKWGIAIVGALTAAAQLEVNTAPLLVGSGVVGIALAFGTKEIIANIVSGVIITIDRPLKAGDVVEVHGAAGEVLDVGLRATAIRTLDNENVLIPNTLVVLNRITNYSKYDPKIRLQIPVHVAYGTDAEKVKEALLDVASRHPETLEDPAPEVRIVEFGDSSVDLTLFAWISEPGERFRIKDEINWEIAKEFSRRGIRVPFSQRDIWMRE